VALGCHTISTQFVPRRYGPHFCADAPVVGQELLGFKSPGDTHTGGEDGGFWPCTRPCTNAVQTLQNALNVDILGFCRLSDGLVVDGEVVHHIGVRMVCAIHSFHPCGHNVGNFVGVRRVVGDYSGVGGGEKGGMPISVLETLTGQGCPPCSGPHDETSRHLIPASPHSVTGALEPKHRIEHVDRHHGFTVGGIAGSNCGERGKGSGFVDAGVQNLPLGTLFIGQQQFPVH